MNKLLLNMKKNKISKQVIIADYLSDSNCADTKKLLDLTSDISDIKIVGAINPFNHSSKNFKYFDTLLSDKKIIGLKIFPGHDKIFLSDPAFRPSIDLCLKYTVPLMIHTGINAKDKDCSKYNNPKLISALAKKESNLKIIISHYFWPKLKYCFSETNDKKNIYFDTSALADNQVIEESGGIDEIKLIIKKTLERKTDSVLFGTDYPECATKDHLKLISSLNIPMPDKENILYKNAVKIFNI